MTLQIDRAAAAARPTPEAVRGWASGQRVFISSVMTSLAEARRAVATAIRDVGGEPVWFENFGGRDDDAEQAYLSEVDTSSIYLAILGRDYGRLLSTRRSATHEEYRRAERRGLRISVWVDAVGDFQGDQVSFIEEIRTFHTTGTYRDITDLTQGVTRRLAELAAEDLSPWCKLGDVVFRAERVVDSGQQVRVLANVHDRQIAAAVEGLRPGLYGQREHVRLTYAGRSFPVRAQSVTATTTASRATGVEIDLEVVPDQGSHQSPMSFNSGGRTYSAEELTVLDLRSALFGEEPPSEISWLGSPVGDLLSQLPDEPMSADLHRAVVTLVVTEALIATGRASRVTRCEVSPPGPNGRHLRLTWANTTTNTASGPSTGEIEGYLKH